MSWLELIVNVAAEDADELGDLLLALGASCVTVQARSGEAVLEPAPDATPLWRLCRLSALLPMDADLAAIRAGLTSRVAQRAIDVRFVDDANWLERWREHAVEHRFAQRLWVVPRDAQVPPGPTVRLDPGLAFGTGGHPTTRLCLEWLAARELRGLRVLDFGCGSGILALAACVLGAREVVAVDHDPQALLATRENAAYNHVSTQQLLVQEPSALAADGEFDLILANILANPLLELAGLFMNLLRRDGTLVLSGLLADQGERIMAGYPQIDFDPPVRAADWLRLSGVRRAVIDE